MYGHNDKVKVVTIRVSAETYNKLQKYVEEASRISYWPRKTVSSVSAAMIEYCLENKVDLIFY